METIDPGFDRAHPPRTADEPISVAVARARIEAAVQVLPAERVPLTEALGLVLSENVIAPYDIPGFPQSSMDGYAIAFRDRESELPVTDVLPAGAPAPRHLQPRTAMRIFTGAPLPIGADTVVMQEKAEIRDGRLFVNDPRLEPGLYVRAQGSEIAAGEIALESGASLTPPAIGFLAGVGVGEVSVHVAPRVTIILTGDELQTPGEVLAYGQVFEANSYSLRAELALAGISAVRIRTAADTLDSLRIVLAEALAASDVVLLSGGVSVGDYDFVVRAAKACGVKKHFHRILQKPGKPLYFGTHGSVVVFGLPGNPASVLTCYYEYVRPALDKMRGRRPTPLREAKLATAHRKPAGLAHFLKGVAEGDTVRILDAQESYRLTSFARANCLIHLDADRDSYSAGETVSIRELPRGLR